MYSCPRYFEIGAENRDEPFARARCRESQDKLGGKSFLHLHRQMDFRR